MSYWKCTSATIILDGLAISMSFADQNSIETFNVTMPTDVWKNICTYRDAYEEPERRLVDAHKNLCRYLFNIADTIREEKKDG